MNRRPDTQQEPKCHHQGPNPLRWKGSECRKAEERVNDCANPVEGKPDNDDANVVKNAFEEVGHDDRPLRTAIAAPISDESPAPTSSLAGRHWETPLDAKCCRLEQGPPHPLQRRRLIEGIELQRIECP